MDSLCIFSQAVLPVKHFKAILLDKDQLLTQLAISHRGRTRDNLAVTEYQQQCTIPLWVPGATG